MFKVKFTVFGACLGLLLGCSPQGTNAVPTADSENTKLMRAEFMESCKTRPEYGSRRRAGTLDAYCTCIFKITMRNLSDDERVVAAFYLYGERNEAFNARLKSSTPNFDAMGKASQAIAKAVESCR